MSTHPRGEASDVVMMTAVEPEVRPGLTELYREHYRPLVKLAGLLLDDVSACEEVVQDAFVAVHRRGLDDVADGSAPAYLRSAVLNGARSQLRRRLVRDRLRPVLPPARDASSPEGVAEHHDDERRVLAALRALPDRQRDVLVLRYWMDLSEAEIAATLGVAAGTVKTHAHRGLETLAATLEDLR